MKRSTISILLVFISVFISSCGKDSSSTLNNNSSVNANVQVSSQSVRLEDSDMFTKVDVKYNEGKKELKVGEISITPGFPESMKLFPSFNSAKTYINSNVKDYYFYTSTKSKKEISDYYRELFKKLEGTEIKQELPKMPKIEGQEPQEQTYYQFEIKGVRYALTFSDILPENLAALKLTGMYVELRKE